MSCRRSTFNLIASCVVPLFSLVACPVDDRRLRPEATSGAGTTGGSQVDAAGRGAGEAGAEPKPLPAGGAGGEGGAGLAANGGEDSGPALIDGCVDLDDNGVGDCDETLVQNGDFRTTTDKWSADVVTQITWVARNAHADAPSGAAAVSVVDTADQDGLMQSASTQCVPITAGGALEILVNFFIPSGQGEGLAAVGLFFFEQPDCKGPVKAPAQVSRAETDVWGLLRTTTLAPDTAASMQIRLAVSKPYRVPAFEVVFDNILVKRR